MTEKNFANMPIKELERFCEERQKELDKALWELKNRKAKTAKKSTKKVA